MSAIETRILKSADLAVLPQLLAGFDNPPRRFLQAKDKEALLACWRDEVEETLRRPESGGVLAESDGKPVGLLVLSPLDWESPLLGRDMAEIKLLGVSGVHPVRQQVLDLLVAEAIEIARRRKWEFLLCKTYADSLQVVHTLEREGFHLMDTVVDCSCDLRGQPLPRLPGLEVPEGATIREAKEADREALVETARAAFTGFYGRFHADENLTAEEATGLYASWIESCLHGWAELVLVAEVDGEIAGFTAWKQPTALQREHGLLLADLNLVAVHPRYRGQGLCTLLTRRGMEALEGSVDGLVSTTHIKNHAVQRVYLKLGWRIVEARHSFHKWIDQG